ncbi:hypothetical protein BT96DRAFT_937840 [Gymnopus androsaceus JB14]|uniref:Uncharacterized protein n=1 Tax=Gymnopus androsaceus JB14 TaxID=1447944 RepID=A0A6A4HXJ0_9AGAR|nr:hypothetical protein BT96DRAFT_937840 [Gymnopus androsaceus JB14]
MCWEVMLELSELWRADNQPYPTLREMMEERKQGAQGIRIPQGILTQASARKSSTWMRLRTSDHGPMTWVMNDITQKNTEDRSIVGDCFPSCYLTMEIDQVWNGTKEKEASLQKLHKLLGKPRMCNGRKQHSPPASHPYKWQHGIWMDPLARATPVVPRTLDPTVQAGGIPENGGLCPTDVHLEDTITPLRGTLAFRDRWGQTIYSVALSGNGRFNIMLRPGVILTPEELEQDNKLKRAIEEDDNQQQYLLLTVNDKGQQAATSISSAPKLLPINP